MIWSKYLSNFLKIANIPPDAKDNKKKIKWETELQKDDLLFHKQSQS
jgi:hypothetical protein